MFVSLLIFASSSWRDPPPPPQPPRAGITTNRRLRSVRRVGWVEFPPPRAPFASAFFKTFALDPGQEFHLELPDPELRPSLPVPWRGPRVPSPSGFSCVSARVSFLFSLPFQRFYFGPSSGHLSPRLGLMISGEPGCEQQVSFLSGSSGVFGSLGTVQRDALGVGLWSKTGGAFLIPDSLTSHLPRTHIPAS